MFQKKRTFEFMNKIKSYKIMKLKVLIFFQEENPFFQGEKLPIAAKKGIHVID